MKYFLLFLFAFLLNDLTAQDTIYRDTFYSGRELFFGEGDIIHVRSFRDKEMSGFDDLETAIHFDTYQNMVFFPNDFTTGFDSIYTKDMERFYLAAVWTYYDRKGTAKQQRFHPTGQLGLEIHYIGKEDTIIKIDSLVQFTPEADFLEADLIELFDIDLVLDKENWLYDTTYNLSALRTDTLKMWHPNGQLWVSKPYKDGQEHGITTAFHKNGQLQEHSNYQDGYIKKTETWYANGQKESNITAENGDLSGYAELWHPNGRIKQKMNFHEGDTIGKYEIYYPNGQLQETGFYDTMPIFKNLEAYKEFEKKNIKVFKAIMKNNPYSPFPFEPSRKFKQGEFQYWDSTGNLLFTEIYEFGYLSERELYTTKEVVDLYRFPIEIRKCTTRITINLPKDCGREETVFCTGLVVGTQTDTIEFEGRIPYSHAIGTYKEIVQFDGKYGNLNYACYYPNGQIQMQLTYKEGSEREERMKITSSDFYFGNAVKYGISKYWYPNGNLKWERICDEEYGVLLKEEKQYYQNGHLKLHVTGEPISNHGSKDVRIYGDGFIKEWYENGNAKKLINYVSSNKEGNQKHWSEDGTLLKKLNYKEDELHDWQYYYDNNGKFIKKEYYYKGELQKTEKQK